MLIVSKSKNKPITVKTGIRCVIVESQGQFLFYFFVNHGHETVILLSNDQMVQKAIKEPINKLQK